MFHSQHIFNVLFNVKFENINNTLKGIPNFKPPESFEGTLIKESAADPETSERGGARNMAYLY